MTAYFEEQDGVAWEVGYTGLEDSRVNILQKNEVIFNWKIL